MLSMSRETVWRALRSVSGALRMHHWSSGRPVGRTAASRRTGRGEALTKAAAPRPEWRSRRACPGVIRRVRPRRPQSPTLTWNERRCCWRTRRWAGSRRCSCPRTPRPGEALRSGSRAAGESRVEVVWASDRISIQRPSGVMTISRTSLHTACWHSTSPRLCSANQASCMRGSDQWHQRS